MGHKRTNGGWQYGLWHMRNPSQKGNPIVYSGHYINPGLNRSRKWKFAASYAEARAKSPFPERPVR